MAPLSFDDLYVYRPASRRVEFGKVDGLPFSEEHFSFSDYDRLGSTHNAAFYMAIAVAFVVTKFRHLGKDLAHGKVDVFSDELVGIFIDGDRRRGMRAKDKANTLFYAAFFYNLIDLVGNVEESRSFRLQRKRKQIITQNSPPIVFILYI